VERGQVTVLQGGTQLYFRNTPQPERGGPKSTRGRTAPLSPGKVLGPRTVEPGQTYESFTEGVWTWSDDNGNSDVGTFTFSTTITVGGDGLVTMVETYTQFKYEGNMAPRNGKWGTPETSELTVITSTFRDGQMTGFSVRGYEEAAYGTQGKAKHDDYRRCEP